MVARKSITEPAAVADWWSALEEVHCTSPQDGICIWAHLSVAKHGLPQRRSRDVERLSR